MKEVYAVFEQNLWNAWKNNQIFVIIHMENTIEVDWGNAKYKVQK